MKLKTQISLPNLRAKKKKLKSSKNDSIRTLPLTYLIKFFIKLTLYQDKTRKISRQNYEQVMENTSDKNGNDNIYNR